ncbi:MAG TPA: methyltransferase domain-containing protein [Xanthobacteraceae bacterium]|jgi:2-polyprenyl-3-methyl-5-hydroxy-6-metoxy-1,4-benzoquinol methylase
MSPADETYQHGHHASVVSNHARRTAEIDAAFFLPYLRPGMRLLDVGCGPGSITAGLARRVEPAAAIGMDLSESVIETARTLAKAQPAKQLSFEVGNIYEPRFPAGSFDAILAHQVLQHLRRPVEALRQMRALLSCGGMVGVRDIDWGTTIFHPENEGMRRFLALYYELADRNGGEPDAGRHLRHWLREAGFSETRVTCSAVCYADPAATREWADTYAARTLHSNIGEKAVEYGIATRSELEDIAASWRAWGAHADAVWCFTHVQAVAWKR